MSEANVTKHTPGRIALRPTGMIVSEIGNVRFIAEIRRHPDSPEQDDVDGEHLIDCWNAIEESGLEPAQVPALKQQRDELIKVAEFARDFLCDAVGMADEYPRFNEKLFNDRFDNVLDQLTLVIAKATQETQTDST